MTDHINNEILGPKAFLAEMRCEICIFWAKECAEEMVVLELAPMQRQVIPSSQYEAMRRAALTQGQPFTPRIVKRIIVAPCCWGPTRPKNESTWWCGQWEGPRTIDFEQA